MGQLVAATDDEDTRRQDRRVAQVLELQYRNAGHLLVSYCTNLSRGGLFVPTAEPLAPGTTLTLSLNIPGDEAPTMLEAEVRWVRQFDAAEGPAGMGLMFDDVDDRLGERIDGIVSEFVPLRVGLVSKRPPFRSHLASQVRSLVSCETSTHTFDSGLAQRLANYDLVLIDVESDSVGGLELLEQLQALPTPPPQVALCPKNDAELRSRVLRLARLVTTPLDGEDLRVTVLETVTAVKASRPEPPKLVDN